MKKIKEIKGDIFSMLNDFDVILHGCNCFSVMGAGFAKQIKLKFPIAYDVDKNSTLTPNSKLGKITHTGHLTTPTIVNLYTQFEWKGKNNVDYDAIRSSLKIVKTTFKGKKIGMPMIGAGLAGGDWTLIKSIIEEELEDENVTVVIYEDNTVIQPVGTTLKTDKIKLDDLIDDFLSN